MTPRGFMFYPDSVPETPPLEAAVRAGIKGNCLLMLRGLIEARADFEEQFFKTLADVVK